MIKERGGNESMTNLTLSEAPASADIIVVGAGGCGLVAALAAAQKGARVLVLEKTEEPGGTTALSGGSIVAAGSRYQREAGIEDGPDALLEEILRRNGNQRDGAPIETLADRSAAVVEWMAETTGVDFEIGAQATTHNVRRLHTWGEGRELVDHLMAAVNRMENIRVLSSTPVASLQLDSSGAVVGVVTEAGVIVGSKVILATGGYAGSHKLLMEYIPKAADLPYAGHHGSTGDGLLMGLEAGAGVENMGAFQPYPCYYAPMSLAMPGNLIFLGAIQVDHRGMRLTDETRFPGGLGARMLDLPDKCAFQVFDQRICQEGGERLQQAIDLGIVDEADTARQLASRLGVDPEGLEKTIDEYNRAAAAGVDQFGREISKPMGLPLYGVKVNVAMYHTQGGLKVNDNAQVLRPDGSVIPNLYAGGGTATGISGPTPEGYLPGNGLLQTLGLGKIAGDHAALSLGGRV